MLVEDLLKNNYLITPAAYFILEPYYRRDFTLAELIKFAKSRGSFVITPAIAEEFLAVKGLISTGDSSPSKSGVVSPPTKNQDLGDETENSDYQMPEFSEESLSAQDLGVTSGVGEGTFISTGNAGENGSKTSFFSQTEEESGPLSEGRSFISTGTPEDEMPQDGLEVKIPAGESSEDTVDSLSLPLEGEAEDIAVELESEYGEYNGEENGNGTKPKIIYGDYGVPIAYAEDEVPEGEKTYSVYADVIITPREGFHYRASEIADDYSVVFDVKNFKFAPPKAKNANGKEGELLVEAYRSYFRSRIRKMRRIFRENPEIGGVLDIGKLSYVQPNTEVTVVGLVNEKRESQKGYILELEDTTGIVKVFVNRNAEDAKLVMGIMKDSVIAVSGRYSGRGMIFAERIYLPDVPQFRRSKLPLEEKVYAILLSDIHVGSNKFCEEAFIRFLDWLNGNVENEAHAELVSRVKYLILAGDVVDGVGIYPGQYDELAIPDIFDQYEALYNLLRNVPKHIHMFIGPGNHDAARTALPQPGFYEEYASPLFRLKNATIISNPAVVRLHGRDFLIAHGRGIEDVVTEIPGRSHHRPAEAMLDLLKLRHLAPTFGEKVPIAPDPEDLLVIESVPDLFQAGHVHVMQYKMYHGVFLINTGTWQAQTEFQKMVNIVPTPARVPIIDVETARLRAVVRFDEYCKGV